MQKYFLLGPQKTYNSEVGSTELLLYQITLPNYFFIADIDITFVAE